MREVDHGWKAIRRTVLMMKNKAAFVKVGILGDADERNVVVGMANEFGTATIPERSFIRSTVGVFRNTYFDIVRKQLAKIFEGHQTVRGALDLLGVKVESDIKNRVTTGEGIPPPNAPATIKAKGSDRTLVDTAQMINSVTHEVEGVDE